MKRPPYSTAEMALPTWHGIMCNDAPTESACVTRMKFLLAVVLRWRYVKKRFAYL
jgi:hypothetical protein